MKKKDLKGTFSATLSLPPCLQRLFFHYSEGFPAVVNLRPLWVRGPQGIVSTVVLEDEKKILLALKEIADLFNQYDPKLLSSVFKLKSLLTRVVKGGYI